MRRSPGSAAGVSERAKARLLADVAERVALLNEFRTDDFQDLVVRLVKDAREHWRDDRGELPPLGCDPLFDALVAIADESDSSPTGVRDACARALSAAVEALGAR